MLKASIWFHLSSQNLSSQQCFPKKAIYNNIYIYIYIYLYNLSVLRLYTIYNANASVGLRKWVCLGVCQAVVLQDRS